MTERPSRPSVPPSFREGGAGALETREPATAARTDASVSSVRKLVSVDVPRLALIVEGPNQKTSRTIVFEGDVCRIGSHASNDVVLDDRAVSRFHCRIVRDEDGWRVVDAGSTNGTFIEGVKIRDADLHDDATLAVGDSRVRVRRDASMGSTAVPDLPAFGQMIGESVAMRKLFGLLERVAASDVHVLIEGESGTGKELVAAEIIQRGRRAEGPFVVVDCGAISPSLVESELFGHVRGAFTGAERDRIGAFEAANGGTVFLDEVGELPEALQPKLLRALEAREIRRMGETRMRRIDVRVVAATNRDLEREVNKGRFREDLYFRLAVVRVRVPALRERLGDLPFLVRAFLAIIDPRQAEGRLFPPEVLAEMARHDWPGNVRELRNYVERSVVMRAAAPADTYSAHPIKIVEEEAPPSSRTMNYRQAKDAAVNAFERGFVASLLSSTGGNLSKAARTAGMDRMYLHRLVQKHSLK